MIKKITFLTSNAKKAQDVKPFGFKVATFKEEKPEVLSSDVAVVALYKALDTGLNNIVVEDTSLSVDGAHFLGTQIKHVYDSIKTDEAYNNKKAVWEVSLCMRIDDKFYISTGSLSGVLKYPVAETGYHFDKIFSVQTPTNSHYTHFELLSEYDKHLLGPRFQALTKMKKALDTQDFSNLKVIDLKDVPPWAKEYQIENKKSLKIKP